MEKEKEMTDLDKPKKRGRPPGKKADPSSDLKKAVGEENSKGPIRCRYRSRVRTYYFAISIDETNDFINVVQFFALNALGENYTDRAIQSIGKRRIKQAVMKQAQKELKTKKKVIFSAPVLLE
jgi:hypothetical protein